MRGQKRYYRLTIPLLMGLAVVWLVLGYVNLKAQRVAEGMTCLAGSIMLMTQAVGAIVCKKIGDCCDARSGKDDNSEPTAQDRTSPTVRP